MHTSTQHNFTGRVPLAGETTLKNHSAVKKNIPIFKVGDEQQGRPRNKKSKIFIWGLVEQVSGGTDPESVAGASSLPGACSLPACSLPASSPQKSMKTSGFFNVFGIPELTNRRRPQVFQCCWKP